MDRVTEPEGTLSPGHWPIEQARFLNRASLHAGVSEACGLILGRFQAGTVVIHRVSLAENHAPNPQQGFRIPAGHLMEFDRAASAEGLEIVGVWHSHPRGELRASPQDWAEIPAGWLGLIVVPSADSIPQLAVYGRDRRTPVFLHAGETEG